MEDSRSPAMRAGSDGDDEIAVFVRIAESLAKRLADYLVQ